MQWNLYTVVMHQGPTFCCLQEVAILQGSTWHHSGTQQGDPQQGDPHREVVAT